MPLELEEIRRRIDATPVNNRGRRKYTAALRREIVAYLRAGIAEGRSQTAMAKELSIHQATFAGWLDPAQSKRKKRPNKKKTALARVSLAPALTSRTRETDSEVVLIVRGGHRVEKLSVEMLAGLLKALG